MRVKLKTLQSKQRGLTLIELMATMAIMAIIVAIAVPSYNHYTQKNRRSDAIRGLTEGQAFAQRCLSKAGRYSNACLSGWDAQTNYIAGVTSPEGFYIITITPDATGDGTAESGYSALAVPAPGSIQLNDLDCPSFAIDHAGTKTVNPKCWVE